MSYGQNQPWGLQAIKTINGGTWNGQTSKYLIQSGYANNIFKGDLVYLGSDGYIHNLSERTVAGLTPYMTFQAIGVFNGCSFTTPTSINPIDPASPGRQFWPAGTVIPGGAPATCDIIDDPSVIYNIQSSGGIVGDPPAFIPGAIPFEAQGSTASVAYQYFFPLPAGPASTTSPDGNFQTGISRMTLNSSLIDTDATRNLRILRFVPADQNAPGINFNNVEVIIQNHSFASRPAGL